MKIIKNNCYKGTRILIGNEKTDYLQKCRFDLIKRGFLEIQIPIIQFTETFKNKVGQENNNLMFGVSDKKLRDLCLAPEYTAIIQNLAQTIYKQKKDIKLFYITECFRGERPQRGRFRQFTQLGIEIINPTINYGLEQIAMDYCMLMNKTACFSLNTNVNRGLDYYTAGKGFEISCNELGSSKQVCGGGEYKGGVGFAIGVDRLLEIKK